MCWKQKLKENGLIFSSILILLIICFGIYFREYLVALSVNMVIDLQARIPSNLQDIFYSLGDLADKDFAVSAFIVVLAFTINKLFVVKTWIYFCFISYLTQVIKLIYQNPRIYCLRPYLPDLPNYTAPDIHPYKVDPDFGNPSGHSIFVVSLHGYLLYSFIVYYNNKLKRYKERNEHLERDHEVQESLIQGKNEEAVDIPKEQKPLLSKLLYVTCIIIIKMLLLLISFSRLCLGLHSINQILLGLSLGTYFLYVFVAHIDKKLENFFVTIAQQRLKNRPLVIWYFSFFYVLASLIPIILYIQVNKSHSVLSSPLWTEWWIVMKNEAEFISPASFAYNKAFFHTGIVGGPFGTIIGVLILNGSYSERSTIFQAVPKANILCRALIFIVLAIVPEKLLSLIPVPKLYCVLNSLINKNLCYFLTCFVLTMIIPILYSKLKLDVEGDYLLLKKDEGASLIKSQPEQKSLIEQAHSLEFN